MTTTPNTETRDEQIARYIAEDAAALAAMDPTERAAEDASDRLAEIRFARAER